MALPFETTAFSFDPVYISGIAGIVLQRLKVSDHPMARWISADTPKVVHAWQGVIAALAAAGMTLSWSYTDSGTLTLSGITWSAVASFLWSVGKNYATGWGAEKGMDALQATLETRDLLKELKYSVARTEGKE